VAPAAPATPTIALDGRGAERGSEALVAGARRALDGAPDLRLRVFGDRPALAELARDDRVELVEAPQEITNDDEPVAAVRSRRSASIVLAAADVAAGRADALVSAGPTGATMAASTFALRRLHGVRRPALALQLLVPGRGGPPILFLDVGANSEVRAGELVQFAFLGSAFSRAVLGVERPRVALLSVGEEAGKGTAAVVDAHTQLRELAGGGTGLVFAGNIEGRDLLSGAAEVIVTDGFTGNVALKTIEGTARAVADAVRAAARSGPVAMAGGLLLRGAFDELREQMDPDTTGGAVMLGLRKVAVVGHGGSGPAGIANAVLLARRATRERAVERTAELLEAAGASRAALRDRGSA
jgi:glycerol-3-phosphate acyltransferase PlsX